MVEDMNVDTQMHHYPVECRSLRQNEEKRRASNNNNNVFERKIV